MNKLQSLFADFQAHADPEHAPNLQRFFKTGPGEYGEGDIFLGIKVPVTRKLIMPYRDLPLDQLKELLYSEIHEHRLGALFILIEQYKKAEDKKPLVDFYLKHRAQVNNWDLVDSSAHKILGDWLLNQDREILYKLAKSKSLWGRRIAVIATFAFIPKIQFEDTLKLAELLLHDPEDLMHKAVGWALREVGKKDESTLESFLKKHFTVMPRTMLRYSIERLPQARRQYYLNTKT